MSDKQYQYWHGNPAVGRVYSSGTAVLKVMPKIDLLAYVTHFIIGKKVDVNLSLGYTKLHPLDKNRYCKETGRRLAMKKLEHNVKFRIASIDTYHVRNVGYDLEAREVVLYSDDKDLLIKLRYHKDHDDVWFTEFFNYRDQ